MKYCRSAFHILCERCTNTTDWLLSFLQYTKSQHTPGYWVIAWSLSGFFLYNWWIKNLRCVFYLNICQTSALALSLALAETGLQLCSMLITTPYLQSLGHSQQAIADDVLVAWVIMSRRQHKYVQDVRNPNLRRNMCMCTNASIHHLWFWFHSLIQCFGVSLIRASCWVPRSV